jgi:hypothetical protein
METFGQASRQGLETCAEHSRGVGALRHSHRLLQPGDDGRRVATGKPTPLQDDFLGPHSHADTQADNPLVEVDADELHGIAPFVETTWRSTPPPVYHVFKVNPNAARPLFVEP